MLIVCLYCSTVLHRWAGELAGKKTDLQSSVGKPEIPAPKVIIHNYYWSTTLSKRCWYSAAICAVGLKKNRTHRSLSPCSATNYRSLKQSFVLHLAGTGRWSAAVVMSAITKAFFSGAWQHDIYDKPSDKQDKAVFPNLLHFTFMGSEWERWQKERVQTADAGDVELLLHTSYF